MKKLDIAPETIEGLKEIAKAAEGNEAVSSNSLFAELISDIEGIASNVANCSADSQASDDCATICQMIQDFKANNQVSELASFAPCAVMVRKTKENYERRKKNVDRSG